MKLTAALAGRLDSQCWVGDRDGWWCWEDLLLKKYEQETKLN